MLLRDIKFRKDGTVKSIKDYSNGKKYKKYTFYRDGKLKTQLDYRMNALMMFNNDEFNIASVDTFRNKL